MKDEESVNTVKPDAGGMSIREMFFKYVRFLPWFALSAAVGLLGAWLYLRYATPIYSSTGSMLIKSQENSSTVNDPKLQELLMSSGTDNIQSEIEVLRSKSLMQRVVHKLDLQKSYFAVGNIKSPNIYERAPFELDVLGLTDSSGNFTMNILANGNQFFLNGGTDPLNYNTVFKTQKGSFRLITTNPPSSGEFNIVWKPASTVARTLSNAILVTPKSTGTGILIVTLESENPFFSADVINTLMAEYDTVTVQDKNANTKQMLQFIDDRMALLEKELDSVKSEILALQQRYNLVDVTTQTTSYIQQISATDNELFQQQANLEALNILQRYMESSDEKFSRVPSTLGNQDPTLINLVAAYNMVQLERKALIDANNPPENALVRQKDEQLDKLRRSILENVANLKEALKGIIGTLEQKRNSYEAEFRSLPEKNKELVEIQRLELSKRTLYEFLMEKREETAISQASTISNSKIIEKAEPNTNPIKPQPNTIRLFGLLAGLALPALIIFLIEISNDKISTRYDIERVTSVPILGEIGHSFKAQNLIVTPTSRTMVAEQFRIIRSNLQFFIANIPRPTILITSSFSGEGKSFITTNVGAVIALTGKKTIILEFDIRKPMLINGLQMNARAGITNYVLGNNSIEEIINPVEGYDNLFVIACGPIPPNPAEMLLDPKISELFSVLKERFEVILIDTAPVGMVSDAMTLSQYADMTLYITRQGYTFKKQVGSIDELYREKKLPKLALIVNDVKLKPGYGYYGYGRYGYGYGYGDGYYEDSNSRPTSWFKRFVNSINPFSKS